MTTTLQTADTALAAAGLPTHTEIMAGAAASLGAFPSSLPWAYARGTTQGLITDEEGDTIVRIYVTENTTSHRELGENLAYLVRAANQFPRLQAELEATRTEANRQNIIADRVAERLRNERDQLHRTLRAVRMMIDGSQPKDLPGAVMAIAAALPEAV